MSESTTSEPPVKKENFFADIIKFGLIALLIVAPIRIFIAKPYIVSGASMSPTFETGHYLFIDLLSYEVFGEPQRGDVIVFRFPQEPTKFLIKRVIGLPGETVAVRGASVVITQKDGSSFTLEEPYVVPENRRTDDVERTLNAEEYFVMGDNRAQSSDSRYWGPLPRSHIVGRAFVRLFPIQEASVFPGKYYLSGTEAN